MPTDDVRDHRPRHAGRAADRHRRRRPRGVGRAARREGRRGVGTPTNRGCRCDATSCRSPASLLVRRSLVGAAARAARAAAARRSSSARRGCATAPRSQHLATVIFDPRERRASSRASRSTSVDAQSRRPLRLEDVSIAAPVTPDGRRSRSSCRDAEKIRLPAGELDAIDRAIEGWSQANAAVAAKDAAVRPTGRSGATTTAATVEGGVGRARDARRRSAHRRAEPRRTPDASRRRCRRHSTATSSRRTSPSTRRSSRRTAQTVSKNVVVKTARPARRETADDRRHDSVDATRRAAHARRVDSR